MTKFNRRNLLKATAVSGSGLAALAYSPRPTLAASDWTVNSPSEVSNDNGELSSLEIPASGFSFSLDYSGLGSGSHSINFELEAKLESDSSFDTVFSDSFSVEGDSGTVSESELSTSFPVDLLANTSMSASDFEEPNAGENEVTTVDFRVSFDWSDGEYSVSDSSNDTFDVTVENIQSIPTSGLFAHYPFDGDAEDETGNGYDGTVNGATYNGSGKVGSNSISFDGSDDEVSVGSYGSIFNGSNDYTISTWVRVDNTTSHSTIFHPRNDHDITLWAHHDGKNGTRFLPYDGGTSSQIVGPELSTDTWTFLTVVFDTGNSEIRLYHNADLKGTSSSNNPNNTSGGNWIGRQRDSKKMYHSGDLDDLRIYDRALSESEISDLYNATS